MSGLLLALCGAVAALAALTCALGGVLWVTSERVAWLAVRVADLEKAAGLDGGGDGSLTDQLLGGPRDLHDADTVTVPVLDLAQPVTIAGFRCLTHRRAGCALCWPPGG